MVVREKNGAGSLRPRLASVPLLERGDSASREVPHRRLPCPEERNSVSAFMFSARARGAVAPQRTLDERPGGQPSVEVEVLGRLLLEPEAVVLGRLLEKVGGLLQHVLGGSRRLLLLLHQLVERVLVRLAGGRLGWKRLGRRVRAVRLERVLGENLVALEQIVVGIRRHPGVGRLGLGCRRLRRDRLRHGRLGGGWRGRRARGAWRSEGLGLLLLELILGRAEAPLQVEVLANCVIERSHDRVGLQMSRFRARVGARGAPILGRPRGYSSVWESAWIAPRRSPVRARLAPWPTALLTQGLSFEPNQGAQGAQVVRAVGRS